MYKRSTIYQSLILFTLLIFFSCRKNDLPDPPPNGSPSFVQAVGQPLEEPYFETVGTGGGTVQSPDGQVTIHIPAGALLNDTEIGVQRIKNTAPGGIGYSYRLTPHGKVFRKKVTLHFSYAATERRLSSSKAVEVAYQNEKGVWTVVGGATNDRTQKSVSIQTDHFSDWSFVASLELSPVVGFVGLGESITLKALRYIFPEKDGDFLVPLSLPEAGVGTPLLLEKRYIVGWTLNGPGKLEQKGAEAVYTAPSSATATKEATVTVELNVNGTQVLLVSTIHFITEVIDISIDGGAWKTYPGMATTIPGLNIYSLSTLRVTTDIPQIVVMWPATPGQKANGIYRWSIFSDEQHNVVFEYATPDLKKIYASFYETSTGDVMDSGGYMAMDEIEQGGKKYLNGMFEVEQAGLVNAATGEQTGLHTIIGIFKVQRSW